MKTATIAALALLVAGCGATTSQHRADGFAAAIADRAFVRPGEDYRPGPGQQPTGVILLSPADADKNAAICNAFIGHLSSIGALREDDAAIIATYWLVEEMPETLRIARNCLPLTMRSGPCRSGPRPDIRMRPGR